MLTADQVIDGKYRIVRLLGEGGMGAVYEGIHTLIHRRVAIKVLHAEVSDRAEAVTRFEREAQAAGRIGSQHIVEVLDFGSLPSGARYLVMEFLQGESLSARLKARGKLGAAETIQIFRPLLDGIGAAHAAGIVHRDLKPDNIFLQRREGASDFVKILDFGISKFSHLSNESGLSMTTTGAVMGTPYYMSPEQARGASHVDHRADTYAAGVILYECLSGSVPFSASSFNELMFKIVLEQPPPIAEQVPGLDLGLARIVEQAMDRDPNRRFASAAAMREALDSWANNQSSSLVSGTAVPGNLSPAAPPQTANTLDALGERPGAGTSDSWSTSSTRYLKGIRESKQRARKPIFVVSLLLGTVAVAAAVAVGLRHDEQPGVAPGSSATSGLVAVSSSSSVEGSPEADADPSAAAKLPAVAPLEQPKDTSQGSPETATSAAAQQPEPREAPAIVKPTKRRAAPPQVTPTPAPAKPASTAGSTAAPSVESKPPASEASPKGKVGDRPIRTTL